MNEWSKGHPYFRTEVKPPEYKTFIQEGNESRQAIEAKAREWVLKQQNISIKGSAWGLEPVTDKNAKGPSSYKTKLTITYEVTKQ